MYMILVSISGGRTSGYMAWWMKFNQLTLARHLGVEQVELVFVFANTGMEHDDTLRFLHAMDKHFGLGVIWVEGVMHPGERKAATHRVVTYETAFRNSQWKDSEHPFHAYISKYGIPNIKYIGCTREMKQNAIDSYMRENHGDEYYTAIGIRADEKRRVSKSAGVRNLIYPLVDFEPVDLDDIREWWGDFAWDLAIEPWHGNCVTCYKKSFRKLKSVWKTTPEIFDFNMEMEEDYGRVRSNQGRTFFRQSIPAKNLLKLFRDSPEITNFYKAGDAGCSESCELYEMETVENVS